MKVTLLTLYISIFPRPLTKWLIIDLIDKLEAHGISGTIKAWIQDWLSGRAQHVVLDGTESMDKPVKSGVPQGSVLGPVLFTIFINDIDESVKSHILKFADDTKLYRKVNSAENIKLLQDDINNLCKWSSDWQIVV